MEAGLKTQFEASLQAVCWKFAKDAIFVVECGTGRIVEVNPEAERLTGYSREELLGLEQARIHAPAEDFGRSAWGENVSTSQKQQFARHKDGHSIPVLVAHSDRFSFEGREFVAGFHRDIRGLEDREHRLAVKRWALSAYASAAAELTGARTSDGLVQRVCDAITTNPIYALAWVGVGDHGPGNPIQVLGASGRALNYMHGLQLSWAEYEPAGRGPTGIAMRTGRVQIVEDGESDPNFEPWRQRAAEVGLRSCVAIPFFAEEVGRCVLAVYGLEPHVFEPIALEAFSHLAAEIGTGLSNLRRQEVLELERSGRESAQSELASALGATVEAMSIALEARDPYTAGHESRVAGLACAIGVEMGWEEERVQALHMAAMVHDIGKISLPAEILTKAGRLTKAEFSLIKEHSETGYRILKNVPFRWPIADIVRQHHEKLDGSGYPLGLKGARYCRRRRFFLWRT